MSRFSGAKGKVRQYLFDLKEELVFTQSELAKLAGTNVSAVSNGIYGMEQKGFLSVEMDGRNKTYTAVPNDVQLFFVKYPQGISSQSNGKPKNAPASGTRRTPWQMKIDDKISYHLKQIEGLTVARELDLDGVC